MSRDLSQLKYISTRKYWDCTLEKGKRWIFILEAFHITLMLNGSPFFTQSIRLAFSKFPSISLSTLQVNVIVDPFCISLKCFPSIVAPLKGESISITSAASEIIKKKPTHAA